MTTDTTNTKESALLAEMIEAVRPIVALIEGDRHPISKYHYVEYMGAIDRVCSMLPGAQSGPKARAIAVALLRAGANREGITHALDAMGHLEPQVP